MPKGNIIVQKTTGVKEAFDADKVRSSVLRAGATKSLAAEVVREVNKKLQPTISSETIYQCSLNALRQRQPELAARYSLKRAIMALGPAGFIFERYVARILNAYGYETEVGSFVRGYCVTHEIDISARKKSDHFLVECKYHNRPGLRSDLKVALYTHSRFQDVVRGYEKRGNDTDRFHQAWIVTNTQCTSEAIAYATCSKVKIWAWRYPQDHGLEHYIEQKRLYPVTILPSLSPSVLEQLSEAGIILVSDLFVHTALELSRRFSLKLKLAEQIYKEALSLCL